MKTIIKILVISSAIVGTVIGFLDILDVSSKTAFTAADNLSVYRWGMVKLFALIAGGLVCGLASARKKSNRMTMVILGIPILICGILILLTKTQTSEAIFLPGAVFIAGGLISSVGAVISKYEPE